MLLNFMFDQFVTYSINLTLYINRIILATHDKYAKDFLLAMSYNDDFIFVIRIHFLLIKKNVALTIIIYVQSRIKVIMSFCNDIK